MRLIRFKPARSRAVLGFCACLLPYTVTAQPARAPDPAEVTTPIAPPRYESVFEGTANQADEALLPWKRLFKPDGSFVPEDQLVGQGTASPPPESDTPAPTQPVAGSDSRGTVKAIYADRGKVKLKHGPIDKLEMPGMTMVFRVKDPALLNEIKKGEEVGFTVEMQGNAFVITGFQP